MPWRLVISSQIATSLQYPIQVERIEKDLYALAQYGYNPNDKGIYRQGLTDVDMQARAWVKEQFEALGMNCFLDGVGNVCGRYVPPDRPEVSDRPAVLIGSHLDSVPAGGMFDGTLGVMAGMECVRVIAENNIPINRPIEVIGTSEEEGRFGGMLGAQALTGNLTLEWLERAQDPNGESLKNALEKCGFNLHDALHAKRDPKSIRAFLELHIEQGPVLEIEKKSVGVVDGISGVFKWLIKFVGKADHAGTAPMHMRSDAFMGVADFAHELSRIIDEDGSEYTRLTIGRVELKPGFAHTIPGEAHFTLVGRDMDHQVMKDVALSCNKVLSAIARKHNLKFEYEQLSWLEPRHFSDELVGQVERNAQAAQLDFMRMPSGAGHDCQFFADLVPTALIFVQSVAGISHAPDEWSHWDDIEQGANLLMKTVLDLCLEDN
ncbi:Zn-dependent hydrolase [Pleionea litopenaei]|uniref:Zn-dependent hydrolase n=1 Tax=Pleionea litopenaei TaxID=3070815 RepID=A0AA51X696_9GAMM|nr:Zn-dependent hydrolase [Pleionea sp. HL-JVS1]WMS86888.1 Zn-dependent hydrolase [Pleionea sp. HL-JVS1]